MLKKLLLSLWVAGALWLWTLWLVSAQGSDVTFNQGSFETSPDNPTGVNTLWADTNQWWNLINVIKRFINWVLGILSLIVLVIVLRGWFQMVTASWDEEKYKKWFKILKQAWLWLVVIWLSWFIVTIVFWILRNTTTGA